MLGHTGHPIQSDRGCLLDPSNINVQCWATLGKYLQLMAPSTLHFTTSLYVLLENKLYMVERITVKVFTFTTPDSQQLHSLPLLAKHLWTVSVSERELSER